MRKINFNQGDSNSYNDGLRFSVAMDPDSFSRIIIRNINGSGFLTYLTESDYIYNLERISFFDKNERQVSSNNYDNINYPESLAWIPGSRVSSLSSDTDIPTQLRLPGSSFWSGSQLVTGADGSYTDGFRSGNTIVISDVFEGGWSGASVFEITDMHSEDASIPFIDIEQNHNGTGIFSIYSSSNNGSIFSFEIKPDISSGFNNSVLGSIGERKINPISIGAYDEKTMIREWNSIFKINKNSNADSSFDTGEIRDTVYVEKIKYYINKNWDGLLRDFLWEGSVVEVGLGLSSNEPDILKKVIMYQLTKHGASDDIRKMVDYQEQEERTGASMDWHIGLGAATKSGDNERSIKTEYVFVSPINKSIEISKVYGLPLKDVFAENVKSNNKLSIDPGNSYIESPRNINGYYPLFLSRSTAENYGDGTHSVHQLNERKYYMPGGLIENKTFFLGNYDPQILLYNSIIIPR